MIDAVLAVLEEATAYSDVLAWLVLGTFFVAAVLDWQDDRERARAVAVAGWGLFGVFWFTLIYHFAIVQRSIIEGVGSVVAVPAAFYVGYLLWEGRDSLFVLTRGIVVMGAIFFPVQSITALEQVLVEIVTRQTEFLMGLLGYHPEVINGGQVSTLEADPYRNTFVFYTDVPYDAQSDPHKITYTILTACTGLGSMAIFGGLITATSAPWSRKLRALAVSLPVIYVLNLVRNVWIGLTFGKQYLHVFPDTIMSLFGTDNPVRVSYYVGDRILAQSLSVVALVAITYLVVRELPEVLEVVEDLLYIATGSEWDLRGALDIQPARADGGSDDQA